VSRGLGFDIGPLVDTIAQAGEKYLDYKTQVQNQKNAQAQAQLDMLNRQRATIAAQSGGIGGAGLALLAAGAFFLLSRPRR
jgi:hypothetical protein